MRENDPRLVGLCDAIPVPALDELLARSVARLGNMHHAVCRICVQCLGGAARCQMARGITLPILALAPHLGNLDPAVALVDRPEGRACLDGLKLLLIANQDNLCIGLRGMGEHTLHLAGADHARFVDD